MTDKRTVKQNGVCEGHTVHCGLCQCQLLAPAPATRLQGPHLTGTVNGLSLEGDAIISDYVTWGQIKLLQPQVPSREAWAPPLETPAATASHSLP